MSNVFLRVEYKKEEGSTPEVGDLELMVASSVAWRTNNVAVVSWDILPCDSATLP